MSGPKKPNEYHSLTLQPGLALLNLRKEDRQKSVGEEKEKHAMGSELMKVLDRGGRRRRGKKTAGRRRRGVRKTQRRLR
jgi:hypothetical protein